MHNKLRFALSAGLLLCVLSLLGVMLLPISMLRLAVTMLLVCFLPGWALVEGLFALSRERPNLAERLVLGMASSYLVTVVGGLWLYYALGRLTLLSFLGLYVLVSVIGFGLAISRRSSLPIAEHARGLATAGSWWLLGLLAFATYFRFYFLSYSDFRGDEAEVVLRAIAAIRGQGEPILSHTKGPAETLVAASVGLLYGAWGELPVRLPFALANWLAVVGTYLLGARLFGRRVAFIATALVAINGWFVTYGRTAQYQNLVLPLSILAVWCCVRFYQSGARVYHLMGILFLAAATFGHYEGASAAPAVLYLLILGLRQVDKLNWPALASVKRWQPSKEIWIAGLSLLLGAAVVLSFYAPFILNPTVAGAQGHVAKRFGSSPPYNNWDDFYVNGLFYNAIYYVLALGGLLLAGAWRGIRLVLANTRWGTLAAFGALPVLLLSWTGLLPPWYALLVYLGLMGLFLLSPQVGVFVKVLLLWIAVPSGLYLFAVERPGNHYYVFMPPLMLLAALALDRGLRWLEQAWQSVGRWALPAVGGVLLVLYSLSAWYEHLVFMRTDLEYMLTYPQHRNPVFWSDPRYPFDIRIGWGFPYRLGWQTISELYRSGQLAGDWYGTDENNSIHWYTLGWPRNPCYPRYFILADIGYRVPPLEVPMATIERYYALRTVVQVNGQPRLRLYEFAPLGSDMVPVLYQEPARYPTPYRQEMLRGGQLDASALGPSVLLDPPHRFKLHPDTLQRLANAYGDPRIVQVQDAVALLGYDMDDTWAVPGGVILVTLHWQAETGLIFPYKVFAHLEDSQLWAQADGEPGCGQFPTYRWRAGDQVLDRHAIFLPEDLPPGDYSVQVGLYEVRTGLRMDRLDELGNPAGNALALPPVTVRPGE